MSVASKLTVGELIDWLSTKPREALVDPDMHCVTVKSDGFWRMQFNYRMDDGHIEFWPYAEPSK